VNERRVFVAERPMVTPGGAPMRATAARGIRAWPPRPELPIDQV
jgi:hypothetical protein